MKLIDSNAAFKNLIFLTAYDKKQVNKSLGESYKTDDACFVDKFFSLEFQIPSRPYTYISQFIIDNLSLMINADSSETNLITSVVNNKRLIQKYIPTLRDAKRFVNQVVIDYERVRGDVLVDEYLLVELLKYRYPDSLKRVYKKEFIERGGIFADNGLYYLKDNIDQQIEGLDILDALFPKKKSHIDQPYHHVYDVQSFDNYFVNQIYASLRHKDMLNLFEKSIEEAYDLLDEWLAKDEEASDVVAYLNNFNIDDFSKSDDFKRYALLVTYVAVKLPQSRAYWLFLKVIYNKNIVGYDKKYNLKFDEYKNSLLSILLEKNIDPLFIMLRSMHMNFVTGMLNEDEVLIQDSVIKNFLFDSFKDALKSENDEEKLKVWLHNCADEMKVGSKKIILNDECTKAYRDHLGTKPEWYIKHFVFLGNVSSSPEWNSIACDGFWEQIFKSDASVKKFIESCKAKNIEGADVASNFWELYKANDFNPIEFQNQGNVQDKIDNKLTAEIAMLNHLRAIEKEVTKIPDSKEGLDYDKLTKHLKSLSDSQNELDSIPLYIRLNGKIREEIERKKSSLS